MKKNCLALVALLLLTIHSLALADDLPWERKLPFKEAIISYDMSGSQQGKQTLYIKDYGRNQARHEKATTTVMGITTSIDKVEITDPDWVSSYDLLEKKGEKITNPTKIYKTEYSKLSSEEKRNFEKNSKELGTSLMGQFGGSVKKKGAQLLGYDCDITTVGGMTTVHVIHETSIPLRSEVSVMGMNSTVVATKVDTASAIPATAFAAPAGIPAPLNQQADSMMTETVRHMVNTLKKPDGAKQLQQAGPMGMLAPGMLEKEMEAEGISKEEQQEMMEQMQKAMRQMQQQKQQ